MLLAGPILVLGAAGFVGANLFLRMLRERADVYAVVRRLPAWRLNEVPSENLMEVDLNSPAEVSRMIGAINPATIMDCAAYGAYSFETDARLIYQTNFQALITLVEAARRWTAEGHHPCRQFLGIRAQLRGAAGDRPTRPQQPLCRLEGRRGAVHCLRRPDAERPDRQPSALLGLRSARGHLAPDA